MKVRIIEPIDLPKIAKKRVCAYARVSTDSLAQGESLENQATYYKKIIETNPAYSFAGVFSDYGLTGTKDDRPGFQKMLSLARDKQIDLIITKSISRFARNTTLIIACVRELKELGVEVYFEKENISTFNGDCELMLTVLSSFAQEESKNISDNVKWRCKRKFEQGKIIINTKRFLGYDMNEKGELVINKAEAELVKLIFNEYLKGKGSFIIAKELNESGVPTVAKGKWHSTTILNILKNEKYKGDVKLQKTYIKDHLSKVKKLNRGEVTSYYIENHHEAIVSREIWNLAQKQIELRGKKKGITGENNDKYKQRYALSGLLFCSKCGAPLRRRVWNSKSSCRKIVWQCSNYIKYGKKTCAGIAIEDALISRLNITEKTVVEEVWKHGKKNYRYTRQGESDQFHGTVESSAKTCSSILPGIDRSGRAIIKLRGAS